MLKKKVFSGVTFIIALSMVFVAINQINDANRASAYIVKEPSTASSENPLKPIIYNGEEIPLVELCRRLNFKYKLAHARYIKMKKKGLPIQTDKIFF